MHGQEIPVHVVVHYEWKLRLHYASYKVVQKKVMLAQHAAVSYYTSLTQVETVVKVILRIVQVINIVSTLD